MGRKAVHYERQEQLYPDHKFDTGPAVEKLVDWYRSLGPLVPTDDILTIQLDFILPYRRTKDWSGTFKSYRAVKKYEAAQKGITSAHKIFDTYVEDNYRFAGYPFTNGLQIDPSHRNNDNKVVVPIKFNLKPHASLERVIKFAVEAVFTPDDINYMESAVLSLQRNGQEIGRTEVPEKETASDKLDIAPTYYDDPYVKSFIFKKCENRRILFGLRSESGSVREGAMIKKDGKWELIEINTEDDVPLVAKNDGVTSFIPALNSVDSVVPTFFSIESDPGDQMFSILGKEEAWKLNTYVIEKTCGTLDHYGIKYVVKFSGNKGWHIEIPINMKKPSVFYQKVVDAVMSEEEEEGMDQLELEHSKSYKDLFFMGRIFVELMGARVMYYGLDDIQKHLSFAQARDLGLDIHPISADDFSNYGIYSQEEWDWAVDVPRLLSVNPRAKDRRYPQFLIDNSSDKKNGPLTAMLSLHRKSGLACIPALIERGPQGLMRFNPRMYDYNQVCELADPKKVLANIDFWKPRAEYWPVNHGTTWIDGLFRDNIGLLEYDLRWGAERMELMTPVKARVVNSEVWKKNPNLLVLMCAKT